MKNFALLLTLVLSILFLSCNTQDYEELNEKKDLQEIVSTKSSATTYQLTAHHISVSKGSWEDAPLSKIDTKDQSGTNDNWNKYIELSPDDKFRGYFSYYLPDDVNKADVVSIKVKTNYKGEKYAVQKWDWDIKNYNTGSWNSLGNNSFASDWRWSSHSWTKTSNKYIKSSNGKIVIRFKSNNDIDVCDLDYLVVEIEVAGSEDEDGDWYQPAPETTFDWILGEEELPSVSSYDAHIIDIDAFDTDTTYVNQLHASGKKAIAYVSVGSWENWRSDKNDFPESVKGNNYPGWGGEKFLDIKQISVLRPLMSARFQMIKDKGFDAIEPDNIDLHTWTTSQLGFDINESDVINYCQMLSEEAHNLGLSIGQKNASDLSGDLVDMFDWALLEGVFDEGTQNDASIYIDQNKAVFATEYTDDTSLSRFQNTYCPGASNLNYTLILKDRDLTTDIEVCN